MIVRIIARNIVRLNGTNTPKIIVRNIICKERKGR